MEQVNVGVIGLGEVAQIIHLPILQALNDRFRIQAVCDISPGLLRAIGDRYGIQDSDRYDDPFVLVQRPDLDAVFVLNSDEYHADCVIAAARTGKHVLVEKPMCLTFAEAEAIIRARDETGVHVMVGYMRRFAPAFMQAVAEVRGLGQINYARIRDIIGRNRLIVDQSSVVLRFDDVPDEAQRDRTARAERLVHEAIGESPPGIVGAYRFLLGLNSHDISAMRGEHHLVRWDTSLGEEQPIAPSRIEDGFTRFRIELPPVGSVFVTSGEPTASRIVNTNVVVDRVTDGEIGGRVRGGNAHAVVAKDGREHRLTVDAGEPLEPLVLDGAWEFVAEDANALVIGTWLATQEEPGTERETYAAPDADTSGWLPMVMGAWSYQLPAEPDRPYPIDVWYRIGFTVETVPPRLDLIVDGFAGSGWDVFVNGEPVTTVPVRSAIDSQMQALEITPLVRQSENVIAVRLTVTKTTDGLLDLVKLMGDFAVERSDDRERISAPLATLQPASWVEQGYPYYSGRGLYRHRFELPDDFAGQRIFLEPEMRETTRSRC